MEVRLKSGVDYRHKNVDIYLDLIELDSCIQFIFIIFYSFEKYNI